VHSKHQIRYQNSSRKAVCASRSTEGRVPEVAEWSERTYSGFPLRTTIPHLCALPSGGRPTSEQETRVMTPEPVIAKVIIHKSLVPENTAHLMTFGGGAQ